MWKKKKSSAKKRTVKVYELNPVFDARDKKGKYEGWVRTQMLNGVRVK